MKNIFYSLVVFFCHLGLTQNFEDQVFGFHEYYPGEFFDECPKSRNRRYHDPTRHDDFGPPKNLYEMYQPYFRDWDGDGSYNFLDFDDDNDGIMDDFDPNPWSRKGWRY